MKIAVLLAAAVSMAAPVASASVLLAGVTNPSTGPLVTGNGNYIAPGFTGRYSSESYYFTLAVVFPEDVFRGFESLAFDYKTSGPANFNVWLSVMQAGSNRFSTPYPFATFQEPAATSEFKSKVIDLDGIGGGYGATFSFSVFSTSGTPLSFDNIFLTTEGNAITAVPEPGSLLGLACLLGAGAFVRRRALRV